MKKNGFNGYITIYNWWKYIIKFENDKDEFELYIVEMERANDTLSQHKEFDFNML